MQHPARDLVSTTLAVLLIGAMIGASIWIMKPFLVPVVWAAMTVISTWPFMLFFEKKLGRRRGLAAAIMTCLFFLLLVLPVSLAVITILDNANDIVEWLKSLGKFATPEAPEWLKKLPYVGARLAARWQEIASTAPDELRSRLLPYAGILLKWFVGQVGNLGLLLLNFLMTLVIAAVLYLKGEAAREGIISFARRIAGQSGEESMRLAAIAIRAVATGVVVTALVQSALSWIGLAVAGMPYAAFLTALVFVLAVAQIGPAPVLLVSVLYLWWAGESGTALGLLLWGLFVGVSDNFIRPVLIRKSGNLSLLLILPGVIGGLIAFGFIGIFMGPVVLAVAYTLIAAWVKEGNPEVFTHTAIPEQTNEQIIVK